MHLLEDLSRLGIRHLRLIIEPPPAGTDKGDAKFYKRMVRLSESLELLPSYPVSLSVAGSFLEHHTLSNSLQWYATLSGRLREQSGGKFDRVDISLSDPAGLFRTPDADGVCDILSDAMHGLRETGIRVVLSGSPAGLPFWLERLNLRGASGLFDVVGIRFYPGRREAFERPWADVIGGIREFLDSLGLDTPVWITETGCGTSGYGEYRQIREWARLTEAPSPRAYWYSIYEHTEHADHAVDGERTGDNRESGFGLKRAGGEPKLLYRIWSESGSRGIRTLATLGGSNGAGRSHGTAANRPRGTVRPEPACLITGGAGFIGTNLAARLLASGERVIVFDNLSRPGVERNLHWLRNTYGSRVGVEIADIRDRDALRGAVRRAATVFHFAAQVAVTSSLDDPLDDFEINAQGTLGLLETLRELDTPPGLVFTSTNKVYGSLEDVPLRLQAFRYEPEDRDTRRRGIDERRPLDFHSPYGCSKGAADQYVSDYARVFGLPTVVFRMSCIYGPHQFGTEDQGWVAHFLIRALRGEPITLYGDGRQVRDILFVEDLVDAFLLSREHMSALAGSTFNIGGGPSKVVSLRELLDFIGILHGAIPEIRYGSWRTGDQRYYVSDTGKFGAATGWSPKVDVHTGVERLYSWLAGNTSGMTAAESSRLMEPAGALAVEGI